jgi:plasmid stabilization system protein ParE
VALASYLLRTNTRPEQADELRTEAQGIAARHKARTIEQFVRMPKMGTPKSISNAALTGLCAWPVDGFENMLIYYVVEGQTLRVLRVLHVKRDATRILKREPAEG